MKILLPICFLLIFSFSSSAQDERNIANLEKQKNYFEKGEIKLSASDTLSAIKAFYHVIYLNRHQKNPNNPVVINARNKIDSLLPNIQKKEIEKWKGKWKLKHLRKENKNYEYIEITDQEIFCFTKNQTEAVRVEKITFAPINDKEMTPPIARVIFKNNEIWAFKIKNVNNETRLIIEIIQTENGDKIHILDERRFIKNKEDREKALEKEIRTYYVLEEV